MQATSPSFPVLTSASGLCLWNSTSTCSMSTVTAGPGGSIVSCRPGPSSSSLPLSPSGTKTASRNGSSKDPLFGTALRFLKLTRRVLYRSYVPIKVDYSDVYDVMAFFVGMPNGQGSHDSLAQKIGEAGRQWAKDYWRYADMACVGEAHLLLGPTPCFRMSSGNADFCLLCGLQRLHVPPLPRVCSHPPPRRRRCRLCRDAVFQLVISRNPFTQICIVPFISLHALHIAASSYARVSEIHFAPAVLRSGSSVEGHSQPYERFLPRKKKNLCRIPACLRRASCGQDLAPQKA